MNPASPSPPPIFVDLDGTLVLGDLSVESLLKGLKKNPILIFAALVWWLRGKAHLKRKLAERIALDVENLPYCRPLIDLLREKSRAGHFIILATASDARLADAVAAHLGFFDDVLASDGSVNLSGEKKRDRLIRRAGDQGFIYAGNSWRDLPVWRAAQHAIVVHPAPFLLARAAQITRIAHVIDDRPNWVQTLLRSMRLHHWSKNLLVFVPIFTAHRFDDLHRLSATCLAFLAFGFVCSAGYILNDLIDLDSDRQHRHKRARPLASGNLSAAAGMFLMVLFLALGFASAWDVPSPFSAMLWVYFISTTAYSLGLKRLPILDVLVLAALFTLRLFAGGYAAQIPISQWLIAFSGFLFVSLALLKRTTELHRLKTTDRQFAPGRGYSVHDLEFLSTVGLAAGCAAVLILAFYINSPDTAALYTRPQLLWLFCPLIFYWLCRMWLISRRGDMTEDPIVFATRDVSSWLIGVLVVATVLLAK